MNTTPRATRTKLLATIAVLWLGAAIGIVAYIAANPVHDADRAFVPITVAPLPENPTIHDQLEHSMAPRQRVVDTTSEDMNVGAMLTWLAIATAVAGGVAVIATTWTDRRAS